MSSVTLAGKTYELHPLPIRKARELRAKISGPVTAFIGALQNGPDVQINDLKAVAALAQALIPTIANSTDIMLDVLFAYSPELTNDRERIEDQATDAEAMTAFVEVLKLLYPFGGLINSVNGLVSQAT